MYYFMQGFSLHNVDNIFVASCELSLSLSRVNDVKTILRFQPQTNSISTSTLPFSTFR